MNEKKSLSIMLIILSIALFFSYHIYYHFKDTVNDNLVQKYYNGNGSGILNKISSTSIKKVNNQNKEEYIGILTIPKINLKTGFYNKNSKNNNVNNSVTLLDESIMPDEKDSIIYLAAHSGSGYLAYFKDLNKLTNNDIIYIDLSNKTYTYTITDIYELPRNGTISVERNPNEDYLILTTCSNNKNMQIVIVSKLIKNNLKVW